MKPEQQKEAGCVIGEDYPERIIDRKFSRERTLAAFKVARET
jgi:deoxyribodipyrimidine photolyase